MSVWKNPDCNEGKHRICPNVGYDEDTDTLTTCPCTCHTKDTP